MQRNQDLMIECQHYFQERPVFRLLFLGFKKKYESFGRLGGSVVLRNLSQEDKDQLGGFFQKDYHKNKTVSISMDTMERALKGSKFAALSWQEILQEYFGELLEGKKERQKKDYEERQQFFSRMVNEYAEEKGEAWMDHILSDRRQGYYLLIQQYKEDRDKLEFILSYILKSIPRLPVFSGKKERLAVFAAQMTGNPHFYDAGTLAEKLLLLFVRFYFPQRQDGSKAGPERKNIDFYEAGILRDDISNHVVVYGIHGRDKNGNVHSGMEGFCHRKEPMILTLFTIEKLVDIWSTDQKVYIVENPAVFSWLCEQYPQNSFVCTNGQLRLADLVLLDHLSRKSVLYYAGDYDPEGLLIAQRIIKRYGTQAKLWKYNVRNYNNHLSTVELKPDRLKKLEKIEIDELQEIKEAMKEKKKAAYQENMLSVYKKEKFYE